MVKVCSFTNRIWLTSETAAARLPHSITLISILHLPPPLLLPLLQSSPPLPLSWAAASGHGRRVSAAAPPFPTSPSRLAGHGGGGRPSPPLPLSWAAAAGCFAVAAMAGSGGRGSGRWQRAFFQMFCESVVSI